MGRRRVEKDAGKRKGKAYRSTRFGRMFLRLYIARVLLLLLVLLRDLLLLFFLAEGAGHGVVIYQSQENLRKGVLIRRADSLKMYNSCISQS